MEKLNSIGAGLLILLIYCIAVAISVTTYIGIAYLGAAIYFKYASDSKIVATGVLMSILVFISAEPTRNLFVGTGILSDKEVQDLLLAMYILYPLTIMVAVLFGGIWV